MPLIRVEIRNTTLEWNEDYANNVDCGEAGVSQHDDPGRMLTSMQALQPQWAADVRRALIVQLPDPSIQVRVQLQDFEVLPATDFVDGAPPILLHVCMSVS